MGEAIVRENYLVKKANSLIEASYKLTLNEQKLVLICASLIKKEDEDFKTYQLSVKHLADMLNMDYKIAYRELQKLTANLMSKVLKMYIPNRKKPDKLDVLQISWFSSVRYLTGEGIVEARFDPGLKPFMINLKKHFTSYQLKNIVSLRSTYSIRIYEILKQYQTIGERTIKIEKLREILGIGDKQYPRYSNFKQKVLKVAYKEISENTDVSFEFEEIKLGRKIDKIKFIIKSKKMVSPNTNNYLEEIAVDMEAYEDEKVLCSNPYIEELKKVLKENLTQDELEAILNVANNNIEKIKEKYEIAKVSKYENLVGFLISAIIKDYKVPLKNEKPKNVNKFNNFEQRSSKYSKEELEKLFRNNK
ncbi:replication initiation protein [Marinisporobacter balticus]|uniref:Plasmid replication initiation protein n=1 Tax=Marinisporobacter balticus TaxID=2018667 RepID=A0A4R2KJA2_9FIRM|nr:replication initiation protein [Marinisporobacter balticus]TCO70679.1 plasmid replication initiation protein [Marinisporobacter balticus]